MSANLEPGTLVKLTRPSGSALFRLTGDSLGRYYQAAEPNAVRKAFGRGGNYTAVTDPAIVRVEPVEEGHETDEPQRKPMAERVPVDTLVSRHEVHAALAEVAQASDEPGAPAQLALF